MLGAGHVDYCVLLGMASWLEFSLASGWQDSSNYLFCYDGLNNHDAIKRAASSSMAAILKDDSFLAMLVDGSDDDDQDASTNTITHNWWSRWQRRTFDKRSLAEPTGTGLRWWRRHCS